MKILLQFQSISDVITNSSSELFCTITGSNIEGISQLIGRLITGDDSELEPTLTIYDEEIEVWLPYDYYGMTEFFKEGLIAILDKYFKNDYKIEWND